MLYFAEMRDSTGSALAREVFLLLLGQRLARARERAGLSQTELARLLAGGRATQQAVSRLESGRGGAPSIITVLEYLRVCGAGVGELDELLSAWTAQPGPRAEVLRRAVVEADSGLEPGSLEAAARYAAGVAAARGKGLPSGRSLRRLAGQAARHGRAARADAELRELIGRELDRLGIGRTSAQYLPLVTFGRMTVAALRRTQKSRYWRARAMERLERWQSEKGLPPDAAARVRSAAEAWSAGRSAT